MAAGEDAAEHERQRLALADDGHLDLVEHGCRQPRCRREVWPIGWLAEWGQIVDHSCSISR